MKSCSRLIAALFALLCGAACGSGSKPNIVFILADDLGWNAVGYHGSQIETPNIDRLAAAGAKLEAFYALPMCTPSRAALLTGRYPIRYGLQSGIIRPSATYGLPLEERTLAQALSAAGYETAIVGKWHLGHYERAYLPTQRGFDHQYGPYNGWIDYFTHERDGGFDWHRDDRVSRDPGYATVLLGDEAVRLIEAHDFAKPLFLYLPFTAPHSPLQAPPEALARRAQIENEDLRTYAAMVYAMDEQIGRVVAAIEARGQTKDTLFVFASDNGGPQPLPGINSPFRGGKYALYEGGVRVPAVAAWAGRIAPGSVVREPLHMVDWFPTLLGLAGAAAPPGLPLDGRDAWPTIAHGAPSPHDVILLNARPRNAALRAGDWKIVVQRAPRWRAGDSRVELFDLVRDPGETRDLSTTHPAQVKELEGRLAAFEKQAVPRLAERQPAGFRAPAVWGE